MLWALAWTTMAALVLLSLRLKAVSGVGSEEFQTLLGVVDRPTLKPARLSATPTRKAHTPYPAPTT